jgi:prolyl-tRNA editing enzyme YbaK/EbsC (Cys-tRNA(Pro) deacylase)
MASLSSSAQRVQDALHQLGLDCRVIEHSEPTRTVKEAAQAVGCQVGQIVKSLVFKGQHSGDPLLVAASGANRVSEQRLAELAGEPVEKPDADYVRLRTGYVIGGVPPLGHSEPLRTFIDQDLFQYEIIWAAAGTPNAVFATTPPDLQRMTGGTVASIKKEEGAS